MPIKQRNTLLLYSFNIAKGKILSRGSYGLVYILRSDSSRIVKEVTFTKDRTTVNSFRNEVAMLQQLQVYPFVPRFFYAEETRNAGFLIMEYIKGTPLTGNLSSEVFTNLYNIIYTISEQSLFHGDIRRDNFIVTPENQVYLIDFGFSSWDHPFRKFRYNSLKTIIPSLHQEYLQIMELELLLKRHHVIIDDIPFTYFDESILPDEVRRYFLLFLFYDPDFQYRVKDSFPFDTNNIIIPRNEIDDDGEEDTPYDMGGPLIDIESLRQWLTLYLEREGASFFLQIPTEELVEKTMELFRNIKVGILHAQKVLLTCFVVIVERMNRIREDYVIDPAIYDDFSIYEDLYLRLQKFE